MVAAKHRPRYRARPMRWLLDSSVTDAAGTALERHGHKIFRPEGDIADKVALVLAADKQQLDLITATKATADVPFGDTRFHRSVVFLQLPGGEIEQDDAIDRLFTRYKRLTPGRLYTVTETRVKVRQLPTGTPLRPGTGKPDTADSGAGTVFHDAPSDDGQEVDSADDFDGSDD
jgi:hypothetical protein